MRSWRLEGVGGRGTIKHERNLSGLELSSRYNSSRLVVVTMASCLTPSAANSPVRQITAGDRYSQVGAAEPSEAERDCACVRACVCVRE